MCFIPFWKVLSCDCSSGGRACKNILERQTEPQITPDERSGSCVAASAILVRMCVCVNGWTWALWKCFGPSEDWKGAVQNAWIYHIFPHTFLLRSLLISLVLFLSMAAMRRETFGLRIQITLSARRSDALQVNIHPALCFLSAEKNKSKPMKRNPTSLMVLGSFNRMQMGGFKELRQGRTPSASPPRLNILWG